MKLEPCKNLDYREGHYLNCELKTFEANGAHVKYFEREAPYAGAASKVQFCKFRGRINSMFDCYEKPGPMNCHESAEEMEEK